MTSNSKDMYTFPTEKRLALVIGVNEAGSSLLPPLQHAVADAQAMAEVLQQSCGFEVCGSLLGHEATSGAIRKAVLKFARNRADDDFLLLYFSGHGLPLNIEAGRDAIYLGSADLDEQDVADDENAHISLHWLRERLFVGTDAGRVLLIFDCCFAGDMGQTAPDHYFEELRQRIRYYLEAPGSEESQGRHGGLRQALTATGHARTTYEGREHGLMTGYLLPALRGEVPEVVEREPHGEISLQRLHRYLELVMPQEYRPGLSGDSAGRPCILTCYPELAATYVPLSVQQHTSKERALRLQALFADHSAFLRDRLESFVGRHVELAEIQQRIAEKVQTGGYVTITGQAGQGKSSIIAKLVAEYGAETCAYHFIPFNPGPDHQVGLLRNVMARLIEKYELSDLYVAAENRAALRDYFPNVLKEVVAKGGQEVIFLDGLDQIEEDMNGVRDLSFLPNNPPAGIVFVLGTRPNDALQPLELLKPHDEYPLRNLQREDFDLILQHRHIVLERYLADQFYQVMQENAFL